MTITNHIRYIQSKAADIIDLVDERKYGHAHCSLDDIEKRVRLAHHHIDYLQKETDSSFLNEDQS